MIGWLQELISRIGSFWQLHYTICAKLNICSLSGRLLIDSWDRNKQDKRNKFLRQAVSISDEIVSLELFYQTSCRLIEGVCSTWVVCLNAQSAIVNPLEKFSQTTFHHIRGTFSTWKVCPDKRCKHLIKNFFEYSRFSRWKRMIDNFCGSSFYG